VIAGDGTRPKPDGVTRRTSFLVLAVLVPALAGCGADDQGEPARNQQARPAAQSTTRAGLIADARRICARMEDRVARLGTPSDPPTPKQMLAIIDAWSVTVDELRKLQPPPAETARFERMLRHFDAAVRAARALPDAKGEQALVPVAAMAHDGMRGGTIAHGYGLDECSLFPPAPSQAKFERYVLEQARKEGGMLDPAVLKNPPGGRLPKPKRR
jgi:hypothetical protein